MLLSILIPSLARRSAYLGRLLAVLSPQITLGVELLIDIDSGQQKIGAKRNSLLKKAAGDYVCFVDDDDLVTADYVAEMLDGINAPIELWNCVPTISGITDRVDAVCIQQVMSQNGTFKGRVYDVPYQQWRTKIGTDGALEFLRGAQHLDAIRREIAQAVEFEEISFGEDHRWSGTIAERQLIKTWYCISKPTYLYQYRQPKEM